MELEVFQYLAAAGDVGVYVVAYALYRFDKRISWIEFNLDRFNIKQSQ